MLDIELQTISSGYDRKTCWVHPRPGLVPGNPVKVVVTMSRMSLAQGKNDVYYSLHEMRTATTAARPGKTSSSARSFPMAPRIPTTAAWRA